MGIITSALGAGGWAGDDAKNVALSLTGKDARNTFEHE